MRMRASAHASSALAPQRQPRLAVRVEGDRHQDRPAAHLAVLDVVLVAAAGVECELERFAAPGAMAVSERLQVHSGSRRAMVAARIEAMMHRFPEPERGPRCNESQ